MARLRITEFTDPGCPFGFSAEPSRRKLLWAYGEEIEWEHRMVRLAETPAHYEEKDITPEMIQQGTRSLAEEHGMPINTGLRDHVPATADACRAIVATRLNAPESEMAILRSLRREYFSGGMIDSDETIDAGIERTGLEVGAVREWMGTDEVAEALAEDMKLARNPTEEALALKGKLAEWEGGWRYTCPSYEIERLSDGAKMSVPGMQPLESYQAAIANLAPEIEPQEAPEDVLEVLEWAGEPLATAEVAAVMEIDRTETREQLARVADEEPAGQDGYWSPGA